MVKSCSYWLPFIHYSVSICQHNEVLGIEAKLREEIKVLQEKVNAVWFLKERRDLLLLYVFVHVDGRADRATSNCPTVVFASARGGTSSAFIRLSRFYEFFQELADEDLNEHQLVIRERIRELESIIKVRNCYSIDFLETIMHILGHEI